MGIPARWAMFVALGSSTMACVKDTGERQGAGYVVGAAGDLTVRIAWEYEGCAEDGTPVPFAILTGAATVTDGQFDLDGLAEVDDDPKVPAGGCVVVLPAEREGEEPAPALEYRDPSWGRLVATVGEIDPDPDRGLSREELGPSVRALSSDVVVVWSSVAVPRDVEPGRTHETSLRAGGQLMRKVTCLTRPATSDPCFDPLPDDAIVLVGN